MPTYKGSNGLLSNFKRQMLLLLRMINTYLVSNQMHSFKLFYISENESLSNGRKVRNKSHRNANYHSRTTANIIE